MRLSIILYPFGMSGLGFVSTNIFPDLTDVDELITGSAVLAVHICVAVIPIIAALISLYLLKKFLGRQQKGIK